MSEATTREPTYRLIQSDPSGRQVRDALADLFAGDGTIYLIVGFFTYNGYRAFRDDVISFLERSADNELKIVAGPSSDQFSPKIASDLSSIDTNDQVEIYKYRRGLHAKLYLREGSDPMLILGSANLTQVGFRYNLELGIEISGGDPNHPHIAPFIEWAEELVETAAPMTRRDLLTPVQIWNSAVNWTNKGRLLPAPYIAKRLVPILMLMIIVALIAGWI